MRFNVGDLYTINGEKVFRVFATLAEPGVVFENITTGERTSMVGQSSLIADGFVRLNPEKELRKNIELFTDEDGTTRLREF